MTNSWDHGTTRNSGSTWGRTAAAYLERRDICPRCAAQLQQQGWCGNCGADLGTAVALTIRDRADDAVRALIARQHAIEALTSIPLPAGSHDIPAHGMPARDMPTQRAGTAAAQQQGAVRNPVDAAAFESGSPNAWKVAPAAVPGRPSREGSQISVQSVLAVVGAGLLGIAAIVFTFLNPDLTNFATRTTIIGVTTGVFLLGAWLLVRADLRFSAEAIGALGMVFVALDIWAFSHGAPHSISPLVFAGIGIAFSAIVLIVVATVVGLRTWLWLGLMGLATVPVWFGYAVGNLWSQIIGTLAVAFAALVAHEIARFVGRRVAARRRADHWSLTTLQLLVLPVVLFQTLESAFVSDSGLGIAAVFAAIGLLAFLSCRNEFAPFWSLVIGASLPLAALSLVTGTSTDGFEATAWFLPTIQAAMALILVVLAAVARIRATANGHRVSRPLTFVGAFFVLGVGFIALLGYGLSYYFEGVAALPNPAWSWGLALALGILVTAVGVFSIWLVGPRATMPRFAHGSVVVAESIAALAVATFAGWDVLATWGQVSIALGLAVGTSLAVKTVPGLRRTRRSLRVPIVGAVHLLAIEAAAISWTSPLLSEIGGAAVVTSWIAVTMLMPRVVRPIYTAVGFAYALIVFAHIMQLANLSDVAILSLTAALASASALLVTMIRRIPAHYWFAVLIVTAVPFVLGVGDVLVLRSGWTGLSTGVTFVLALTLVLTTRPGLSRYLRAVAAALLVPSLAVVVVDLGAQLLKQSASPYTLPAIAIIVACVLPSTTLIGAALERRGHAAPDARLARLWIEISTLVTGAIAVILALVRAAAGLNTSFVVLLIIGIGAAATALITHRRYGWIVAAASWTGALWSFWGILGVSVIEPYVLPPALAAAAIGAIAVARRLPGVGLYAVGLTCAAVPTLAVLADFGNGSQTPWRTLGLFAGSIILVALGTAFVGRPADSRARLLALPTLLVGILAAAGGAIQAVRVARGADLLWLHPHDPVMVVVIETSVVASALAAQGARMLATPDRLGRVRWRWIYMPAVIYLAVGPIVAVRASYLSLWTLFILTIALLAFMVLTVLIAKRHPVALPPVWFTFGVAWCVAVAGWSTRLLRVEAFSLPLGLALLAVGIIVMIGRCEPVMPGLTSWPLGFTGSWRLLTPGIVVTFLPSVLSTGTDPTTPRAILVIGLALVAILVGSLRKLGAPFILGIVVLPIENITVFAAQIGHTISATSWWITLATAGAVLLVIAVTYERRTSGERGVAARLRDLR